MVDLLFTYHTSQCRSFDSWSSCPASVYIYIYSTFPLFHCHVSYFFYFTTFYLAVAGPSGRAVGGEGLDLLDDDIVGLNSTPGMDVCPGLSVLCCPMAIEALRRADPPSKESYQMSNRPKNFRNHFWTGTCQNTSSFPRTRRRYLSTLCLLFHVIVDDTSESLPTDANKFGHLRFHSSIRCGILHGLPINYTIPGLVH
jgi:hypothetical protein